MSERDPAAFMLSLYNLTLTKKQLHDSTFSFNLCVSLLCPVFVLQFTVADMEQHKHFDLSEANNTLAIYGNAFKADIPFTPLSSRFI